MAISFRSVQRVLLAVLPLTLAACQEGVYVDVDQVAGRLAVAVQPRSSSSPPCVERLIVYRNGSEATAIWHIVRMNDDICLNRFTFGEIPQGFISDTAVQQPARGVEYKIDISGVGFKGGTTFKADGHDGRIGHG